MVSVHLSDSIPAQLAAESFARNDWVDMRLADIFMQDTKATMPPSLLVAWIMAAVLSTSVPFLLLVGWLAACSAVILVRFLVAVQYERRMRDLSGAALSAFLAKSGLLWPLAGLVWGSSTALFFSRSSGFEQLTCITMLIGVCCVSIYSCGSRLQCSLGFVYALCGSVLVIFLYSMLVMKLVPVSVDSFSLIALDITFAAVMRKFAIHFHGIQRKSFKLQYDNAALIKSLTAKSDAALEAVQNKNRLIASAAHDLRQPVHALNLYASWLVDEPELGPKVAPQIVRCTRAVNELFDSLFDFSGLNADATKVNWQRVDLADVMADLQAQYAPLAHERGLQLRLRQRGFLVDTDPVLLKRLLGNLISNALKNTRQGGVLLGLRRSAGNWRVGVWDTGCGIEPAYQQAIFKEFYRVPRAGTADGFGLGLAISVRLAQLLGLTLGLRSSVGKGSAFWIEQTDILSLRQLSEKARR